MHFLLLMLLCILAPCSATDNLFIVNSNSQTLSGLDDTGIDNTFATLGQAPGATPNKMAILGDRGYVVLTYENSIQRINLNTGATEGYIYLENSAIPYDIAINGDYAYVTGNVSYKVYRIDLESNAVVDAIDVGVAPQSIVCAGEYLYVSNTGFHLSDYTYSPGSVSVIGVESFSVIATIPVHLNPTGMAFDGQYLHVACSGDFFATPGVVDIVDIAAGATAHTVDLGGAPGSVAIGKDGRIFVANSWPAGIYTYDSVSWEILSDPDDHVFAGGNTVFADSLSLWILDAGDYVHNSTLYRYNYSGNSLTDTFTCGIGATDIKAMRIVPPVDVPEEEIGHSDTRLICGPNPMTNTVRIAFAKPTATSERFRIAIYNVRGERVYIGEDSGDHMVWDGKTSRGNRSPAGVYFVSVAGDQGTRAHAKILKLK